MHSSPSSPLRAYPVCGDTHHEPLHEQRFLLPGGHPMADHYTLVSCGACGFVFADTTVDQKKFDAFYAALSKYQDSAAPFIRPFRPIATCFRWPTTVSSIKMPNA